MGTTWGHSKRDRSKEKRSSKLRKRSHSVPGTSTSDSDVKDLHFRKKKINEVERPGGTKMQRSAGELEIQVVEEEAAKRIEEIVEKKVEEELDKRKDEIDDLVEEQVEEAERLTEAQTVEELERTQQILVEVGKNDGELNQSCSGKVCYLEAPYGVVQFKPNFITDDQMCYLFFIFDNVYNDRKCERPIKNGKKISIGEMLSFQAPPVPVALPQHANIKCFHGGLLWKSSKPEKVQNLTVDYEKAVSILTRYLNIKNGARIPAEMTTVVTALPEAPASPEAPAAPAAPALPKAPAPAEAAAPPEATAPPEAPASPKAPAHVQKVLSGGTGIVWKVINNNEGLMFFGKSKRKKIIWFNRSNLEKVQEKFHSLRELLGVALHFDAELLHAPANPSDYVWYQVTAFWDEKKPKPSIPNGVVGVKILDYEPKSDFSSVLKRGVEFKLKNPLSHDEIDNVFRCLADSITSDDVPSPPKKKVAESKEVKKEGNPFLESIERAGKKAKTLKTGKQSRRTPVSGLDAGWKGWKAKSKVFLRSEPKNEPFLLNLKKTVKVPDYFFQTLSVKTVFKRLLLRKSKSGETIFAEFPKEINEEDFVNKTEIEKFKKLEYLKSVEKIFFAENVADRPKYLLNKSGSINHLSGDCKAGLIQCKYGSVYFKWEDFLELSPKPETDDWKSKNLSVFFDGYYDPHLSCPYVATCVWTEKRPDIRELIKSVADVPEKLKPGKYEGRVVKLDLPSNAIVKLNDENVAVVVARGIFDPTETENIADFLSLRENLEIVIGDDSSNNYYAENASRKIRLPPNLSKTIQGYATYTNSSNRLGIFEYRLKDCLLTGICSKDLVKSLPLGSHIRISGYLTNNHEPIRIVATEVENVKVLKENRTENFLDSNAKLEFFPKKVYVGVVKEIRKPYACVLEAVNEEKKNVKVFVQSRKLAPGAFEPNLRYDDQIQNHVKVEDKIKFTAEVCSDTLGLHPFKWHAERAWKIENSAPRLNNSSEGM